MAGDSIENAHPDEVRPIDWTGVSFVLVLGLVDASLKLMARAAPDWNLGTTDALVSFLMCMVYIIVRARRQPEKLDAWGLTTPLTPPALAMALVLLAISVGNSAGTGLALTGSLSFEASYVPSMVDYILGAFPQQFAMCSVGLVSLSTLPAFRGSWRLPLTVGLVFSLCHWWTPAKIPGTFIPLQMLTTFPAGYIVTLYFLKYRSIMPLTIIHAISFILEVNWVEVHL